MSHNYTDACPPDAHRVSRVAQTMSQEKNLNKEIF